jgi:hypothetical protein
VSALNARIAIRFRVLGADPAHTRVGVFTGRNLGSLGQAGTLVIRTEDWPTIRARLGRLGDPNLLVVLEDAAEGPADELEEWAGRHDQAHPIAIPYCPLCAARTERSSLT